MTGKLNSKLDSNQIMREVYNDSNESLTVSQVGSNLVNEEYDALELTYVTSGNGVGEIETVTYKKNNVTVATLTLGYNVSNKLISVVKS